jgi:hypothetical protein
MRLDTTRARRHQGEGRRVGRRIVPLRNATAALLGVALVTALAFLAGGKLAGGGSTAAAAYQYQYGNTVTICHHTTSATSPTVTITIAQAALDAHLAEGDTVGPCR